MSHLLAWLDNQIASWLRPVVELREPEATERLVAQPAYNGRQFPNGQFRVLTPEMQRRIDQST